jgi:hypothetical protein
MARPGPPYSFRATEVSRFIFSNKNPPALQNQNAVLAPELQLAVDAFAHGADENAELFLRDVHFGTEIAASAHSRRASREVNTHSMAKLPIVPAKI